MPQALYGVIYAEEPCLIRLDESAHEIRLPVCMFLDFFVYICNRQINQTDETMLERDYIMRLVREFAEALELLLNKKDRDTQREEIRTMYTRYVGPYEFYHTAAVEDVMQSFEQYPEEERLNRMEMLAELYYVETSLVSGPVREMMLGKALAIFDFVDSHDRTYSLTRIEKMGEIRRKIKKLRS